MPTATTTKPIRNPSNKTTKPRFRIHGMDGFRALAALAIIAFHTYLSTSWVTSGSANGIEFVSQINPLINGAFHNLTLRTNLFFVLSGMLLSLPFVMSAIQGTPRPRLRRYVRRRIQRIWPLYILVMLVAASTVTIRRTGIEQVVLNTLLIQNIAPGGRYLLPQTWTLTVEIGFYLLLPLMIVPLLRVARRMPTIGSRMLIISTAPLVWFLIAAAARANPHAEVFGVLIRSTALPYLDNFAAGILAAMLVAGSLNSRSNFAHLVTNLAPWVWTGAGSLLVFMGLYARWVTIDGPAYSAAWWWVTLVACGIACWFIAVALRPDRSFLARVVNSPALLWLGQVSYGLFLWHYVVLHWFSVLGITRSGGIEAVLINLAMVLVTTIPLAWFSWHLIEWPVLDGRIPMPQLRLKIGVPKLGKPRPRPDRF